MFRLLSSTLTFLVGLALLAGPASAGHAIEAGVGWQNTGATREQTWAPAIQGSRKDVPLFVGWRYVGERRVYYAPFARLQYTNVWSIGGGGNLLAAAVGPAGLGVYLTQPPAKFSPEERRGRWFATFDIHFGSLQIGGNVTPGSPENAQVPDPEAHRAALRAELKRNGKLAVGGLPQRYPLGDYSYVSIGFPIHLRAWNQVTKAVGVGFFLEVNPAMLEWSLDRSASSGPAYGYNLTGGVTAIVF